MSFFQKLFGTSTRVNSPKQGISGEFQDALWLPAIALQGITGGAAVVGSQGEDLNVEAAAAQWALPLVQLLREGDALARSDQFENAIVAYKRVLERCPTAAIAMMSIGNCYAMLGSRAQARDWLERALAVDPGRQRIITNLNNLRS
jgi:Flp pilus assembly protein TadD